MQFRLQLILTVIDFKCDLIKIKIGHYNPSVRMTTLLLTPFKIVCVNFIHEWRDLLQQRLSIQTLFVSILQEI